jgi:hypothetical protein
MVLHGVVVHGLFAGTVSLPVGDTNRVVAAKALSAKTIAREPSPKATTAVIAVERPQTRSRCTMIGPPPSRRIVDLRAR